MPFQGSTWVPYETMGNVTTPVDIAQYNNTVTGDLFGVMGLVAFFFVLYITMSQKDRDIALPASMFITTIAAILMAALDIIADEISWAALFIMVAVTALYFIFRGGGSNV